VASSAPA